MNVLMGKKITFFTLDNKIKCRKKGDNKRSTTIWNAFTHEQFIFSHCLRQLCDTHMYLMFNIVVEWDSEDKIE